MGAGGDRMICSSITLCFRVRGLESRWHSQSLCLYFDFPKPVPNWPYLLPHSPVRARGPRDRHDIAEPK